MSFIPEDKGVESLARQIRLTGRAYALFDIAFLILKKPDRYTVRFTIFKRPDGQAVQPLFVCGLDDTLWLSEQETIDHVLNKHFAMFYQAERIATDPPKGTYTFVAQCGMSGAVLGPPNYHDYQNKLRKLHSERFSRVPFEVFKSRIKIVRDEAVVKKWLDEQSWKTEYVCLNVPDTIKLANRDEVQKHFRETHLANVVRPVDSHTLSGTAGQALPTRALQNAVRRFWDEQMRFPIKLVNILSQQFAGHGLQFFKVNRTVTHVAAARPHFLDLEVTPVSDGIRRIVDFIDATSACSRRKIVEALVQSPAPVLATAKEGEPAGEVAPSPEAAAVISDLHWLIHQGHVIEFANGLIEMAKRPIPIPKPTKPEPTPTSARGDAPTATPPADATATPSSTPASETPADSSSGVAEIPPTPAASEPVPTPVVEVTAAAPEISVAAEAEPTPTP